MHPKHLRSVLLILFTVLILIPMGSVNAATFFQDQKLTSADFTTDTILNIPDVRFSKSVAVSGNWMAVGAPGDNANQGSVKIYERVSGAWEYRTQLLPPAGQVGSEFGFAVDVYEAGGLLTVIVGAPLFDTTQPDAGRAFVYSDTNASASAFSFTTTTLNSSSAESSGRFGYAVALHGDLAAISEPNDDVTSSGSVSIRGRNIGGTNSWGQAVAPKTGNLGNGFGTSIDVHGEYLIVGAPYANNVVGLKTGQAYVYRQDLDGAGAWGLKHTLNPATAEADMAFGFSVGIWDSNTGGVDSASRSVVGAPLTDNSGFADVGSVSFFNDATVNFTRTHAAAATNVSAHLGYSVAIEGDNAIAGRPSQTVTSQAFTGQVDTFSYNGTIWATNTINLTQTGAQAGYYYGHSVDISGLVAIIGAPSSREDALNLPPGAIRAGIVETLDKPGPTWAKDTDSYVRAIFDQPNTAIDQYFGYDVDMTDTWLAVGAQQDGQKGVSAGAVYMYRNIGGVWTPHSKLTALYGQAGDLFGSSVAVLGTRLIVGAPGFNGFPTSTANAGAIYSFVFDGTHWVQTVEVTSPNPVSDGRFGVDVEYHGDVIVVGASGEDGNKGRAYAYRDLSSFTSPITLNIPAASAGSGTGNNVSVYDPASGTPNDEVIAIGAYNQGGQGAAYVLSGSTFSTITTLVDPNPGANRFFGYSVSISNGRVAVGAPTATTAPSGRVVVFSGSGYATATSLTLPTGAGQFGFNLDLEGDSLVVGSPATAGRAGTAHVFGFSAGTWTEQGPLQPSDLAAIDEYGITVTQNNGIYVIGAPLHNANSISDSGAAYVFSLAPEVTVTPTTADVDETGPTTDTFVVALNQSPATNVTIQLTFDTQIQVDAGSGFGASPQTVTLTPANALSGVTVSVRAVDDLVDEAAIHTSTITTAVTSSATPRFNGLAVSDVTVNITDNDTAGVTITQTASTTAVTEAAGGTDTYTIVLDTQPTGTVNVALTFPATEVTVNGDTDGTYNTTFTTANWNTAQTITVAAVNDRVLEGDHTATLTHAFTSADANYQGIVAEVDGTTNTNDVTVAITDNESAVLEWVPTTGSAAEGTTLSAILRMDITADPAGGTPTLEGPAGVGAFSYGYITAEAADRATYTFGGGSFADANDLATISLNIPHLNDTLVEGDETYTLTVNPFTPPSGKNITIAPTPFTGTITDADAATVAISGTATVGENVGSTPLTVTLTTGAGNTLEQDVTVAVNLVDGTATYGGGTGDFSFTGPSNTVNVTFPAASVDGATQVVNANINNDVLVEGTEAFTASLGTVTGAATVTGSPATITITDNDTANVTFQAATSNAPEGTTPHTVVATLNLTTNGTGTPQLQSAVTVNVTDTTNVATTPADYTLSSTSITFPAASLNSATQNIDIAIVDDVATEGPHDFSLGFGTVTGAATASGSHVVTIIDNDIPGITVTESAATTAVTEGGANDSYTVVLDSQPTQPVTINITFNAAQVVVGGETDGTHSLTFTTANWNSAQTVTVAAVNDTVVEANPHTSLIVQTVSSTDPIYSIINPADVTVSITDNDTANIVIVGSTSSVNENGSGTHTVTARLDITGNGAPGGTLSVDSTVDVVLTDGTAAVGTDYSVNTISFSYLTGSANGTLRSINVTINNDRLLEASETFTVSGTVTGGLATLSGSNVVTIVDDEVGVFSFNLASDTASEAVGTYNRFARLTITGSGIGSTFRIQDAASVVLTETAGTATTPADYSLTTTSLSIPANAGSPLDMSFDVAIVNDSLVEATDETFTVGFGAITGPANLSSTGTHVVTIDENDTAIVAFAANDDTVAENVGSFSKDVTLSLITNPAGGTLASAFVVPLTFTETSANEPEDFTLAAANVTFPAGSANATTLSATANIVNDSIDENAELFDINLDTAVATTNITFGRSATTVTITDDDTGGIVVTQSDGNTAVTEGVGSDSYTVTLTSSPVADVNVNIAFDATQLILNGDTDGSLTVTLNSGNWNTGVTVNVVAVDDTLIEVNPHTSSIVQTISTTDPIYSVFNPDDVTVTITENDFQDITFSLATSSVAETAGSHVVNARLNLISNGTPGGTITADMTATVNVALGTAEAGDFTLTTTSVTFPSGTTHNSTLPIDLSIINDLIVENSETLTLSFTLVTATGTVSGTHVITISDDESAVISFEDMTGVVSEATSTYTTNALLDITGSGTGTASIESSATVVVNANDLTATSPADYALTTTSITFSAGSIDGASTAIDSAIVNDQLVESSEYYELAFGTVTATGNVTATSDIQAVEIEDNDTAEIVFETNTGSVNESAGTYTVNAVLNLTTNGTGTPGLQNEEEISITQTGISATNVTDYSLTTALVTFTPADGNGATKPISVSIVSDAIDENNETFDLDMSGNVESIPTISETSHTVTITDDDTAGVIVTQSGGTTNVTEGGALDLYDVVLATQPANDVTVTLTFNGQVEISTDGINFVPSPVVLTFTSGNWNVTRTLTVQAVNDTVVEGAHTALIDQATTSADPMYNNIATADVTVNITDNDTAEVIFSSAGFSTVESAVFSPGMTLKVTANGAPGGSIENPIVVDMLLTLGTAEASDVAITTAQATFPAGSTDDTVVMTHSVSVTDDLIVERTESFDLSLSINSGLATTTALNNYTIVSDDTAAISYSVVTSSVPEATTPHTVTALLTLNGGGTGVASIEENIDVVVTETAGTATTPADYTLTTISIKFAGGTTNGATASIQSTIVNDALIEGSHDFTLGFGAVTTDLLGVIANGTHVVTIVDDDFAGVTIVETAGDTEVTEAGPTDTFTVTLNAEPTSDVTITFDVGTQVTFAPNPLVITPANWNVAQTVTVTAVDDVAIEGAHNATVGFTFTGDANFAAITPNSIAVLVSIIDNDVPGITVTQSDGSTDVTEGGATDTYTVVLLGAPTQDVTITFGASTQVTTTPTPSLTFTPANYNVPQTVTVTAVDDAVYEGDHTATITHTVTSTDVNYNGFAVGSVTVNITDGVSELIINGSFETAGTTQRKALGWTGKKLTSKDRRICTTVTAVDGVCVFQFNFTGPSNVSRRVIQAFTDPVWGDVGNTLNLSAQVSGNKFKTGAKMILQVTYTDGTKERVVTAIPTKTYAYTEITGALVLDKRVKKVVVNFNIAKTGGRVWIDDVSLLFTEGAGIVTRTIEPESTALPLPVPPSDWRD